MATQTIEFHAPSGQTITAKLFALGSDTELGSASATERTNDKGTYRAAFTDKVGTFRLTALVGSVATAKGFVTTMAATGDYFPHSTLSLATQIDEVSVIASSAAAHTLQTTTIATLASQVSFTLTAGSADDDVYNDAAVIFVDQSTGTQKAIGYVADYVGSTKTVKLLAAPGFTIATGDTVHIFSMLDAVRVEMDAVLTTSAGVLSHVAAWLNWRGQRVAITGATCSVTFRELSGDTDLFTITESDDLGSSAIFEDVFRLDKATPTFTDDRIYVVTAAITLNGREFIGTQLIPCLGGA